MSTIKVVRSTVKYVELPQFVLIDEMPPAIHAKVLEFMGDHALDIHDDAVAFSYKLAPNVKSFMEQLGVNVHVQKVIEAEGHSGVMICLYPPEDVAKKFAVEGGEPVENMHVTLGFLGKKNELPDDVMELAEKACKKVAAKHSKLDGNIGGIGRWAAGKDGDCIYASVDVPGSNELRADLCAALEEEGIPPKSNHGWSAHMTIQYVDPDKVVAVNHVEPVKVSFDSIWVVSGDKDRKEIKLGGSKKSETVKADGSDGGGLDVNKRRWLDRHHTKDQINTILDNVRDGHVSDENLKIVKDMTGMDPTKPEDYKKLREQLGITHDGGATAAEAAELLEIAADALENG